MGNKILADYNFRITEKEAIQIFLPNCIPIIQCNLLRINKEMKQLELKRKNWLRKRKEMEKSNYEWFLDILVEFLERNKEKLLRNKNRYIRYLYYTYNKDNKEDLGKNFFEKVALASERDILEIISQYTKIEKSGINRYKALCPLHKEEYPSLTIYLETQSWFCFSCQQGGSVIDFIMKVENLSFREAIKRLII